LKPQPSSRKSSRADPWSSEARRQKAEGRRQKAEGRRQKDEVSALNKMKNIFKYILITIFATIIGKLIVRFLFEISR
jgi:hypothetical protein